MRVGLIKKSLICVLSLSFCALLASCKKVGSNQSVSKKNVFAQKDILAYAKKNKLTMDEFASPTVTDINVTSKYSVQGSLDGALLLLDRDSSATKLYTRKSNQIIDLSSDTFTSISGVYVDGVYFDYDLYSVQSTTEKILVDNFGNKIISGKYFTNLSVKRIINTTVDGDNTFYEIITYYVDSEAYKEIYKVEANIKGGTIISSPTRTKIESADEIDYSAMSYSNNNDTLSLKEYDVVMSNGAIYVYNLSGKIVSTFDASGFTTGVVLDDKIFFQTTTSVNRDQNYTYNVDDEFYYLQTYSVDLKTGIKKEVKNYNYLIGSNVTYILGYDEKKDREYVAAEYAQLYEIVDKRLQIAAITGMIGTDGKMISTKVGEVGYHLAYLDDNAYVLYDRGTTSILDGKGKLKASFSNNNGFNIDYKNKLVFIPKSGTSGILLDSDLKVIDYPGRDNVICYGVFSNGNAIVYMNGVTALVKFNGNKMEIVKTYDGSMTSISKPYGSHSTGYTCVAITDTLVERDLYIVATKADETNWNVAIVDANGEIIKEYNSITGISAYNYGGTFIRVVTSDATIYIGSKIDE